MTDALLAAVERAISCASGKPFVVASQQAVGGGCINRGLSLLGADSRRYFVKLNQVALLDMFEAEATGLGELDTAGAIRVPQVVAHGVADEHGYLVLEWLDLRAGGPRLGVQLGEQLAQLHRCQQSLYGWQRDNYIGSTPQANSPMNDWVAFYRERRLRPQLELSRSRGATSRMLECGERLMAELPAFFSAYTPQPSLLHGDLWGGNAAQCESVPVLFDPAVYFGDRETDLAMTELFGGFPPDFYAAYKASWPLDAGYASRKYLYQLYHLLNHFNLFGTGYARQVQATMDRLLAELR